MAEAKLISDPAEREAHKSTSPVYLANKKVYDADSSPDSRRKFVIKLDPDVRPAHELSIPSANVSSPSAAISVQWLTASVVYNPPYIFIFLFLDSHLKNITYKNTHNYILKF